MTWNRPPTVFTAANMAIVREMAANGKTAGEIAGVIGTTAACVGTMCSKHSIELGTGGAFTIRVSQETRAALLREGQRRGRASGKLIREILTIVVKDNLFVAVLGEPRREARN